MPYPVSPTTISNNRERAISKTKFGWAGQDSVRAKQPPGDDGEKDYNGNMHMAGMDTSRRRNIVSIDKVDGDIGNDAMRTRTLCRYPARESRVKRSGNASVALKISEAICNQSCHALPSNQRVSPLFDL